MLPCQLASAIHLLTQPESVLQRKQALREAGYHGLGAGSLSLRSVGGRRGAETAIRSLLCEEPLPFPGSGYSLTNGAGRFVWPRRALDAKVSSPWLAPLPRCRPAGGRRRISDRDNRVPRGVEMKQWCWAG